MNRFAVAFVVLCAQLLVSHGREEPQQEYIMEYQSPEVQAGMLVPSGLLQPAKTYVGSHKYVLSSDFYPENDRDAYSGSAEKRSAARDYSTSEEYSDGEAEPLRRLMTVAKDGKSKVVFGFRKDSPKRVVVQKSSASDDDDGGYRNVVLLSKSDRSYMKPVMAQVIYVVDNKVAGDDGGDRVDGIVAAAAAISDDSDAARSGRDSRRPNPDKDLDWYPKKEYSKARDYPDVKRVDDAASHSPKRILKKDARKSKAKVSDPPASTT